MATKAEDSEAELDIENKLSISDIKENVQSLIDAEIGDDVKSLSKVKDMLANALKEKKRLEQQVSLK